MIVRCERCQTRFRLDASRLPPGGARVRCSRCRHAFFLRPEDDAEAAESAGARSGSDVWAESGSVVGMDAPTQAPPAPPSPAPPAGSEEDPESPFGTGLFEDDEHPNPGHEAAPAPPPSPSREPSAAPPTPAGDDESDWEFDTDLPIGEVGGESAPPQDPAPAPSDAAGGLSLDDLGDPGSWDVVGPAGAPPSQEMVDALPQELGRVPEPGVVEDRAPEADAVAESGPETEPEADPPAAAGAPVRASRRPSVAESLGWLATGVLLLIAVHGGLRVEVEPLADVAATALWEDLAVEALRVQRVENLHGPTLVVVRGRLANPNDAPRTVTGPLALGIVDARGRVLAQALAAAGAPLGAQRLRLDRPDVLREAAATRAHRLVGSTLAPGARVPFEAVFAHVPAGAARIVPLAFAPAPGTGATRAEAQAPPRASSSPPAALPSAE